jgi:extracellular matrix regulatory protein A
MEVLNVGYGNLVPAQRVVAVLLPDSLPAKRLRDEAAKAGRLLDATQGRRTRSIVVLDSEHLVLCAVQAHTLSARLTGRALVEEEGESPRDRGRRKRGEHG